MSINKYIHAYLEKGWKLILLKPRSKEPLSDFFPNGLSDATDSFEQLQRALNKYPDANLAVVCGPSNLAVLDIDNYKDEDLSIEKIETLTGIPLSETITAKTGNGGFHYYFSTAEKSLRPKDGFQFGCDFKAGNSYVVLPPSIHPATGLQYEWKDNSLNGPLMRLPQDLLRHVQGPKDNLNRIKIQERIVSGMGRWNLLQAHAGVLRSLGWGQQPIEDALMSLYNHQFEPSDDLPLKIRQLAKVAVEKWEPSNTKPRLIPSSVVVQTPDGRSYEIPFSHLHEAEAAGARRIK